MLTSYRQERATELRRRKIFLGVFLVVLTFVFGYKSVFGFMKKIALSIGNPAWQSAAVARTSLGELHDATISRDDLLTENTKLKQELDVLSLEKKTISALRVENEQLRSLGGRNDEDHRIYARVLSRPPVSAYDTFIIDAGYADGVEEGMRALIGGDFYVGDVTTVGAHTSLLTLASAASVATNGLLSDHDVIVATTTAPIFEDPVVASSSASSTSSTSTEREPSSIGVETTVATSTTVASSRSAYSFIGLGNGGFRAFIPKQVPVSRDEAIALTGEAPSFLGIVTGVYMPPSGSLKEVYAMLPKGIGQIEWVSLAPPLPEGDLTDTTDKTSR